MHFTVGSTIHTRLLRITHKQVTGFYSMGPPILWTKNLDHGTNSFIAPCRNSAEGLQLQYLVHILTGQSAFLSSLLHIPRLGTFQTDNDLLHAFPKKANHEEPSTKLVSHAVNGVKMRTNKKGIHKTAPLIPRFGSSCRALTPRRT